MSAGGAPTAPAQGDGAAVVVAVRWQGAPATAVPDTVAGDAAAVAATTRQPARAPMGPPQNAGYMAAAYTAAAVIYLGYIAVLLRRLAAARRGG